MAIFSDQPDPFVPALPGPESEADGNFLVDAIGAQGLGYSSSLGEAARSNQPAFKSMTTTFDDQGNPIHDIKGVSQAYLDHIQRQIKFANLAQATLQRVADAATRKANVLEQHPILAGIGRATSSIAAQYAAPGSRGAAIVRGLGAFGADFFQDTPEQLLARAASAQKEGFGIEGQVVNQLEDIRRSDLAERRADLAEQRAQEEAKRSQRMLDLREQDIRRNTQDDFVRAEEASAREGNLDAASAFEVKAAARPDLFTPAEVKGRAEELRVLAKGAMKRKQEEANIRVERYRQERAIATMAAAAAKAGQERSEKVTVVATRLNAINDDIKTIENAYTTGINFFDQWAEAAGLPPGSSPKMIAGKLQQLLATPDGQQQLGISGVLDPTAVRELRDRIPKELAAIVTRDSEIKRRQAERKLAIAALPKNLQDAYKESVAEPVSPEAVPAPVTMSTEEAQILAAYTSGRITREEADRRFLALEQGKKKPKAQSPSPSKFPTRVY